jgi:hypothetical protein
MGLRYDSWGTYAARKVIKGVNRKPRRVQTPAESAALTQELVEFWLRTLGITFLARVIRKVALAWWAAARADLLRRAEARRAAE